MSSSVLRHLLLLALIACGDGVGTDGDVVGGACATDDDCDSDSRCQTSGRFPGGTCTVPCSSNADCPDGSRCISESGGICALACESAGDCRSGYACNLETAKAGGSVQVCSAAH